MRPSDLQVSAVEGDTVSVLCSVDSNPPASVVWRHQDTGGEHRECSLEWKYSQVTSPTSLPSVLTFL